MSNRFSTPCSRPGSRARPRQGGSSASTFTVGLACALASALALLTSGASGCGPTSGEPSDAGEQDVTGNVTCKSDKRAMVYTANLEQDGLGHLAKFTLVQADPGPPLKGSANQWTIKVTDANGQPFAAGADITIAGMMPDHGHGWSTTPTITKNADGTVTFARMNMFMHGIWEITFTVTSGTTTDSAVYSFCVD